MFNQEDLNKLNDYTFAFLEGKKSSSLLDKVLLQKEIVVSLIRQLSPHCVDNSKSAQISPIPARPAGGRVIRAPFVIFVHHS